MRNLFITVVVAVSSFIFGHLASPAVNVSGIQGGAIGPLIRDTVYSPDKKYLLIYYQRMYDYYKQYSDSEFQSTVGPDGASDPRGKIKKEAMEFSLKGYEYMDSFFLLEASMNP